MPKKRLTKAEIQSAARRGVAKAKRFQPGGAVGATRRAGANVARKVFSGDVRAAELARTGRRLVRAATNASSVAARKRFSKAADVAKRKAAKRRAR